MALRAMAFAFIGIIGATAVTAADGDGAWRTVAKAPRSALPDVHISLGYPGPYIPRWNSPIVLHATAQRPFNGYIGFRFGVGRQSTRELPVVSPVRLQPGQSWSFSTWARIKPTEWWLLRQGASPSRELVIEWRNAEMKVVAQQSLGVPPWSDARPLYLGTVVPQRVLGETPYVAAPDALSTVAQWYGGFYPIVVPLSQWLDLRRDFREAIVSSAGQLVFVGFPRPGQSLGSADRALLPVDFTAGASSYSVPWPYPPPATRSAPLSWRIKGNAVGLADGANVPVVIGTGSSWAAAEDLIYDPLPETEPMVLVPLAGVPEVRWSLRGLAKEFAPLLAGTAMLLFTIAAWSALRRRPRIMVAALVVAVAIVPFARREWLHRGPSVETYERVVDLGDGVLLRSVTRLEAGPAPLRALAVAPTLARTAVFSENTSQETEIRMAGTPIGFGAMFHPTVGWDSAERSWTRREIGKMPSLRIVEAAPRRLVIDYESAERLDYASASWVAGGQRWFGEVRLPHPTKGRVTIPNERLVPMLWPGPGGWYRRNDVVSVELLRSDADGWKEFTFGKGSPATALAASEFVSFTTNLARESDGSLTGRVSVPARVARATSRGTALLYGVDARELTIVTKAASATVANQWSPRPRRDPNSTSGLFEVPPQVMNELRNGGILVVKIRSPKALTPELTGRIMVKFEGKRS